MDSSYHLILTKTDNTTVDVGNVRGAQGATGPAMTYSGMSSADKADLVSDVAAAVTPETFWIHGTWDDNNLTISTQTKTFAQISAAVNVNALKEITYVLTGYNSETLMLPLVSLTSTTAIFGNSYVTYASSHYSMRHVSIHVTSSGATIVDTTMSDANGGQY